MDQIIKNLTTIENIFIVLVMKIYSQSVLMTTNYFVKFTSYGLLTSDILLYGVLHTTKRADKRKF